MPRRGGKSLKPSDFEPRRKNKVSLGSDSNIDNDFKAFKRGLPKNIKDAHMGFPRFE